MSALYTLDALLPECVGRYITGGPKNAVVLANLVDQRTLEEVWAAFTHWVVVQFDRGNSVCLSPVGVVRVRRDGPPEFHFLEAYAAEHGLRLAAGVGRTDGFGSHVRVNHALLGKMAGADPRTVATALTHITRRLGEVLADKRRKVLIDLGVGAIVADRGLVDFVFHEVAAAAEEEADTAAGEKAGENAAAAPSGSMRELAARRRAPAAVPRSSLLARRAGLDAAGRASGGGEEDGNGEMELFTTLPHGDLLVRTMRNEGEAALHRRLPDDGDRSPMDRIRERAASPPSRRRPFGEPRSPATLRRLRAAGARAQLPPVLDAYARTRAATFDEEATKHSVSSKIASFYTPSAASLEIDPAGGGLRGTGFVPFPPADADGAAGPADEASAERYRQYAEAGFAEGAVAPIKGVWLRNALSLVSSDLGSLTEEQVEQRVREMVAQVRAGYGESSRRAILDYVLRNSRERQRLGVPAPPSRPADWGLGPVPPSAPLAWRRPIQETYRAVSDGLFLFNPAIVSLLEVWTRYEHQTLVRLPRRDELPVTVAAFCEAQAEQTRACQEALTQQYLREVEAVFQAFVEANTDMDEVTSEKFFNCVATVMAAQLRGVVARSVDALAAFFAQFEEHPGLLFRTAADRPPSVCAIETRPGRRPPAFLLQLGGDLEFATRLEEHERAVSRVFDSVVGALDGVPRVESKIFSLLEESKALNLSLAPVPGAGAAARAAPGEDAAAAAAESAAAGRPGPGADVWSRKAGVMRAFRRGTQEAARLARLYGEYAYLHDEEARVLKWLTARPPLGEVERRVGAFRELAARLEGSTTAVVHAQAVAVDCTRANHALAQRAAQLARQILQHLAAANVDANAAICDRFKQAGAELLKKPMNSTELVALHKYLQQFKGADLERLTRDCAEAREQLRFLYRMDHPVGEAELHHVGATWAWLRKVEAVIADSEALLRSERVKMERQLGERRENFEKTLEGYAAQVREFATFGDMKKMGEYLYKVEALKENLGKADSEIERVHEQEQLLGLPRTAFSVLDDTRERLEPYEELWTLASGFSKSHGSWLKGGVFKLNAAEVERDLDSMLRLASRLTQDLAALAPEGAAGGGAAPEGAGAAAGTAAAGAAAGAAAADGAGSQPAAATAAAAPGVAAAAAAAAAQAGGSSSNPAGVCAYIKKELEAFKPQIPLLRVLCNEGMRERHWKEVSDVVGFDLRPDGHTSLTRVLDMGVDKYLSRLEEIGEAASKQYGIERALETMKGEWTSVEFELKEHRDTGTHILGGASVEEAQTLLDDHLIKTQSMKGSSFARPFAEELRAWEEWLRSAQQLIEVWVKVQAQWMYLEPVFGAADILRQMPTEGSLFKSVDGKWRSLVARAAEDPNVRRVAGLPNVLPQLTEALEHLERIQTGLNQYLETKRLFFPRFFFLSNDELLEILSETRDPLRVQPHLKKCFEGVARLRFAENLDIMAMQSREGEEVAMARTVNPNDAQGAVEWWLKEVEAVMFESVHDQCRQAVKAYGRTERIDWVLQWPGQVVLAVNQIFWTHAVEAALRGGADSGAAAAPGTGPAGATATTPAAAAAAASNNNDNNNARRALSDFLAVSNENLQSIVMLVRGKLSKLARATLGSLVVVDVHARDTVQALLDAGVRDEKSFDWSAQMRYYWEEDTVRVRMLTSCTDYGNEYLGNSSRLVITPLTDRCYRTLMGAVQLELGGAPEGPAGTGKTETVKDLAKAIGIQCVVFNCSDGLDYLAMAKFFKGLASSGAWACFDEFNRIDLEVLSVVAQQIQTIVRAKEARAEQFLFEGTTISLRRTANCFITMNPGYAGRAELPDNLKALFRTVAMMVPDYALIAEIMLYSYGFVQARSLSRKIVATFRLCSEQLSSQDHYDYGMRAVRTVLTAAKRLKQACPDEDEEVLMLRSITDANRPKFLSQDLPLFDGILSDLFPSASLPEPDQGELLAAVRDSAARLGLQPEPAFLGKVMQLYETVQVRHGLMLVGLPSAGKTSAYRVLAGALTDLASRGHAGEQPVRVTVLNPKAVTMGQLYGQFDPVSHEWSDGVLATKFREAASDQGDDRKWLVFDGPVDAIWIENMNTVLDDNKKLCLMSGEIVQMSDSQSMIFEVRDLAVASPATVSRCGMVYMEPGELGWRPMARSWLESLPDEVASPKERELVHALLEWLVDPCLRLVRGLGSYSPTTDAGVVTSLTRVLRSRLEAGAAARAAAPGAEPFQQAVRRVECAALFAVVWSAGAAVDLDGRPRFDAFLRELCRETGSYKLAASSQFPSRGSVYDYFCPAAGEEVDGGAAAAWRPWSARLEEAPYAVPDGARFQEIIVPTVDTVRYSALLDAMLAARHPCLLVGPTGTGKSVIAQARIRALPSDAFASPVVINFSAQTTAGQTQGLVDDRMDRRRRGVYGPAGGKRCVVFVDDLNMPRQEEYGAQPPVELLRQYMDHGGWYDVKERSFRQLDDVQFVAAMGPAGGGRKPVTDRFLRHFTQVSLTPFDDPTLDSIFGTIVRWHFAARPFAPDVAKLADGPLVAATRVLFRQAVAGLLPTPAKSHYTFNLRDFSRVVQGLLFAEPAQFVEPAQVVRLWIHEVHRVFGDRLVDEEDSQRFFGWVRDTAKTHLKSDVDRVCAHLDSNEDGRVDTAEEIRGLFFGDYMEPAGKPAPGAGAGAGAGAAYAEVSDPAALQERWTQYLAEYNQTSKRPMNLVMFRFAVEHASRIARVLKQPGGNALLVGVGGSGKQSLVRLAASMRGIEVVQVELTKTYGQAEWRDDLRALLRKAGGEGRPTAFVLTDAQVQDESFLEDVNAILNSGEVPNLWSPDEAAECAELVRPAAKRARRLGAGTPAEMMAFFTERVRANLHVVLCMSPIGNTLRDRLRAFPSLVNCCTIDWFRAWPDDALLSVARHFLRDLDAGTADKDAGAADTDADAEAGAEADAATAAADAAAADATREACVLMCKDFHQGAERLADDYWNSLSRKCYVTPTSYLELLGTLKTLLGEKRDEIRGLIGRYQSGLDSLHSTAEAVKTMQAELEDMQPDLARTSEETGQMIEVVRTETVEANKIRDEVAAEEKVASESAARAKAIETECASDLAEAMPILEAALAALDTLTSRELSEMKAMRNPPSAVKMVMECLCHVLGVQPARVPDPSGSGKMVQDYWEPSKKSILSDPKLLRNLKDFDKDNIPPPVVKKIRHYMTLPDFDIAKVKKVSKAAHGLCSWIYAMEAYDRVAKIVGPKKEALARAQSEFEQVKAKLDEARAKLATVEAKIGALNDNLQRCQDKKAALEHKMEDCSVKLERANVLLGGLGGEKERWTETRASLGAQHDSVLGDVLVASAAVAYLGPFTAEFRQQAVERWTELCRSRGVACSGGGQLLGRVLGDPVKVRQWTIDGLPNDTFSVDNAIITSKARRWPLMIDPQGQANKWVRRMEADNQLLVVKPSDEGYARRVEGAVQYGHPVLLEDVGESLDPVLEPLLLRQVVRRGGSSFIAFGDGEIEYSPGFRLYITTRLANPHYLPEVFTRVTILNFMATPAGLEDQLLGIVVAKERAELEEERSRLVVQTAENARKLKEIEDQILQVLSSSEGNILDDEHAIQVLSASKTLSDEIGEKQRAAQETEEAINETRMGYQPVARHAAVIFFCVAKLARVDPMYQYSLDWFIRLFVKSIGAAEFSHVLQQRVDSLCAEFTRSVHVNVCRSLFARDELLFTFLLATGLGDGVDPQRLRALLSGAAAAGSYEEGSMPPSGIDRLCAVRALQPDKLVDAVRDFVGDTLGPEFVDSVPFEVEGIYNDSDQVTPLVFILSRGVDPSAEVFKLAEAKGVADSIASISLGQGQGPVAERAIEAAVREGTWVLLQNCHLAVSWLPRLERIVNELSMDTVNPNFRLWLTSMPSPAFPVSVLQSSVKVTTEPPRGVPAIARMSASLVKVDEEGATNATAHRLLHNLCLFHAAVLERRSFGPVGFNIPYEFTASDLEISARQLRLLCEAETGVDHSALLYLVGELNFGGRVTDSWDRRALNSVLAGFLGADAELIALPEPVLPGFFGLHENAAITSAINEANALMGKLLGLQPRTGGSAGGVSSRESTVTEAARGFLSSLPANFDVAAAARQYPVEYSNSMNTVLVQEIQRYNALLDVVRESLKGLLRALKGEAVMSEELEAVGDALFDGRVPALWSAAAYPSVKPLVAWFSDLRSRVDMFAQWISEGQPPVFWVSGFFFTQSFLTAALQDFARKEAIAIDELGFDFEVMGADADFSTPPDFGVYIRGLHLEGASWDAERRVLADARPRELFSSMPVIWLKPSRSVDIAKGGVYECPVYRTSERRGTLTTTGHSSNFVLAVRLPVFEASDASRWVKAGVALLCQLDS